MSPCATYERLLHQLFLDGLTKDDKLLLRTHLKSCVHCQTVYRNARTTHRLVDDALARETMGTIGSKRQESLAVSARRQIRRTRFRTRVSWSAATAVAATLLLAFVLSDLGDPEYSRSRETTTAAGLGTEIADGELIKSPAHAVGGADGLEKKDKDSLPKIGAHSNAVGRDHPTRESRPARKEQDAEDGSAKVPDSAPEGAKRRFRGVPTGGTEEKKPVEEDPPGSEPEGPVSEKPGKPRQTRGPDDPPRANPRVPPQTTEGIHLARAKELLDSAGEAYTRTDYTAAVRISSGITELPESEAGEALRIRTSRLRAWCLLKLNRHLDALALFKHLKEKDPRDNNALIGFGLSAFAAGDYDNCIRALRHGLSRRPDLISLRLTLGWACYSRGKVSTAKKEFERVGTRYPDALSPLVGRAWCAYQKGKWSSAHSLFKKAQNRVQKPFTASPPSLEMTDVAFLSEQESLARERSDDDVVAGLGFSSYFRGEPRDAAKLLEPLASGVSAKAQAWDRGSETLEIYARALQDSRRPKDGLVVFDRLIARHPEGPRLARAWACKGWCALKLNDVASAKSAFERALALSPRFRPALDGMKAIRKRPGSSSTGGMGHKGGHRK